MWVEADNKIIIFLSSLLKSYENIVYTMFYVKETLSMANAKSMLNFKEIPKMKVDSNSKTTIVPLIWGRADGRGSQK